MPVKRVVLDRSLTEGDKVDFWIDCGANDLFGNMKNDSVLQELCIAEMNVQTRALAYDMLVLLSVCEYGKEKEFAARVETALSKIIEKDANGIDEKAAAGIRAALAPLLAEKNDGDDVFEYTAVGHAHLDLAWLWPLRESKRKGARTFTNQFLNIERYPGYVFGASQAQLYRWVKDSYPRVYAKVKELAKTPSWDVQGATWVEMDSNLIGGESMIRQFYYGKRFFKEEFGQDMRIFWVPDSFGYSACIPQVMKLAEVDYFLTQKMSWNTVTKFPYHTFRWQGLDGSEVLAHMLPEDTYNSPCDGARASFGEENYMERKISNRSMMLFGIGDGGAGPGYEHVEKMERLRDLKGLPKVTPGKALGFFEEIDKTTVPYPVHKGELYLERHQGTYTTQARNKRFNRKCEFALINYELLLACAGKNGIEVPIDSAELDEMWREILLYQFHDILPGSSINRVYEESRARYAMILDKLNSAIKTLLSKLTKSECVYNFTSYNYDYTFKKGESWLKLALPALGEADIEKASVIKDFAAKSGEDFIENDRVKITFKNGFIVSYYDKLLSREFADSSRPMGVYSQYEDHGDCWDIRPVEYQGTKKDAECISFKTGTDGASAFARISYKLGECEIEQTVTVIDGSPRAVFDAKVNCRQESSMIRCAFPTSVKTDEASFNIQFGHITRKTTENTDAEKAQFEVSGQKFIDLSDGKSGISLINDCKYGCRCKGDVIDIDLIRSPENGPGKQVDQGENVFTLALYPHEGGVSESVYREAYILNNPPLTVFGVGKVCGVPEYTTDNENIILESVKCPADGRGVIIRYYNASSTQQTANIKIDGLVPVETVNILEKRVSVVNTPLVLHPFELVNIRYN